jgi:molybdopterin-guanine dinucleotide biosynthesis protein A
MGTAKAGVELAGRPLIAYPLAALTAACGRVLVVAKADSDIGGVDAERWDEPDEPRHPLAGITYALERAAEPILVCGADMPFVTAEVVEAIAAELRPDASAVVAVSDGRLEPLLAAYAPSALEPLRAAPGEEPLRRSVEALRPALIEVAPDVVFNVNTPDDLAEAERRLRSG